MIQRAPVPDSRAPVAGARRRASRPLDPEAESIDLIRRALDGYTPQTRIRILVFLLRREEEEVSR